MVILVLLPAIVNLPWALAGRPLMGGDNLTQNYPLRVLAGELIRHGGLPLWNPDIWSGTPLLAGWNAGAMFPGTWLFAALPGVAAWEVNVIAVGVLAGVGMHLLLRRVGCSPLASLLGALTFANTGFMSGQSTHLGLVQGVALAPFMLLALDWLVRARASRFADTAPAIALLGVSGGLVVLAGDPRAISDDAVIVAVYLGACCIRALRARSATRVGSPSPTGVWRLISSVGAAAGLAAAVSAVQWLPGLAFLHHSQRSVSSLSNFGAGSLGWGDLGYLFVPFIYGGNGNYHMPTFAGSYNLPELTYGVGLLPLAALGVLTVRTFRKNASGVRVWLVMFVVGVLLSAGTNTPLGRLLVRVPLYGGERLQNRNSAISDLALAALLAVFFDFLQEAARTRASSKVQAGAGQAIGARRTLLALPELLGGLVAPLVAVALVVAMYVAPSGTQRLLGTSSVARGLAGQMTPYYAVVVVIALATGLLLSCRSLSRLTLRRLASAIVIADVTVFLVMATYQPAATAALAARNPAANAFGRAANERGGVVGERGRVAIFNPQQLSAPASKSGIDELGLNDLVILHHFSSVQGYGSVVSAIYEAATAAHEVENLRPAAFVTPTLDVLNLRALATLPELLGAVEPSAAAAALPLGPPRPPGTSVVDQERGNQVDFSPYPPSGPWRLGSRYGTWFVLPGALVVDRAMLRFEPEYGPLPRTVTVHLTLRSGGVLRRTVPVRGREAVVWLPAGLLARKGGAIDLGVFAAAAQRDPILGALEVHVLAGRSSYLTVKGQTARPTWFALNGLLQGLIPPDDWSLQATIGPVELFRNLRACGPAWLEPSSAKLPTARRQPGRVISLPTMEWQDPTETVDTPRAALLVRSESFAPGWSVSIAPTGKGRRRGAEVSLPVVRIGAIQGVELPAGDWKVTWHYASSRAEAGLAAGAAALLASLWLLVVAWRRRRTAPGDVPVASAHALRDLDRH